MRSCTFKVWDEENRVWGEVQNGKFHGFGKELHEDSEGFHENTIAIVEGSDGQLYKTEIHTVQFLEP